MDFPFGIISTKIGIIAVNMKKIIANLKFQVFHLCSEK